MSNSVQQVAGGEIILHEIQDVDIDQQTSVTAKAMNDQYYLHKDWMKPTPSDYSKALS